MQPSRQLTYIAAHKSLRLCVGKGRSTTNANLMEDTHFLFFFFIVFCSSSFLASALASRFALDSFCMGMCCGMSTHKSSICLDVLRNFSLPVTVRGRVRERARSLWQPGSRKVGKEKEGWGCARRKDLLFLPFKFSLEPSFA